MVKSNCPWNAHIPYSSVWFRSLAALFLIQPLAEVHPGKQQMKAQLLVSTVDVENLDGALGSWPPFGTLWMLEALVSKSVEK